MDDTTKRAIETQRLCAEAARALTPAQRDRLKQLFHAQAMSAGEKLRATLGLINFAVKLKKRRRTISK